jgi:hypothetical protein
MWDVDGPIIHYMGKIPFSLLNLPPADMRLQVPDKIILQE